MSRYVPVKGSYWWRIKIGDGEQTIGKFYSKDGADEICRHLDRAFRDGYFVASGDLMGEHYTHLEDSVPVSREALEALRVALAESSNLTGCLDGYCLVTGSAKGMHTNGGCRCWRDQLKVQRAMQNRLTVIEAARRLLEGGE